MKSEELYAKFRPPKAVGQHKPGEFLFPPLHVYGENIFRRTKNPILNDSISWLVRKSFLYYIRIRFCIIKIGPANSKPTAEIRNPEPPLIKIGYKAVYVHRSKS